MSNEVLKVSSIEKRFGEVRAVADLSFGVEEGEIFAFLGPNGAGKTTSVRMLMNIIRPDSGTIRFFRSPNPPCPTDLGYLPEERGLYPDMPVGRTLTYFGTLRRMEGVAAREAAAYWLERMNLTERANDKLSALSKGNQQKVQLIAAVIHQPRFVVLDEPFSGLDPLNQDLFLDLIRGFRDRGSTVLLSAHQMSLVERLADRVLLLNHGRALLHGSLEDIKAEARSGNRLVVGFADPPAFAGLAAAPEVATVEPIEGGKVALQLRPETALGGFIRHLAGRYELTSIHSEEVSLHDIYVQRVEADRHQKP